MIKLSTYIFLIRCPEPPMSLSLRKKFRLCYQQRLSFSIEYLCQVGIQTFAIRFVSSTVNMKNLLSYIQLILDQFIMTKKKYITKSFSLFFTFEGKKPPQKQDALDKIAKIFSNVKNNLVPSRQLKIYSFLNVSYIWYKYLCSSLWLHTMSFLLLHWQNRSIPPQNQSNRQDTCKIYLHLIYRRLGTKRIVILVNQTKI